MSKITLLFLFLPYMMIAQIETISFEKDGLVFIDVKLNDHEEVFSFVFDTGASIPVLDSTVAVQLGIVATHTQSAEGVNGSKVYELATGQTIRVGKLKVMDSKMVLVNLEELAERMGRRLDGIIGYELLSQYVTKMDFDEKKISWYESTADIPDLDEYAKTRIRFKGTPIPLVKLTFTLKDGSKETGRFLFDSGADLGLMFNAPFAQKKDLKNRIGKTIKVLARGLNQQYFYILGSLEQLELGGTTFTDLPVDVSESKTGVSGSSAYDGILGAKVLNRFNMILDYKNRLFYHQPNQEYGQPFLFPTSGIQITFVDHKIIVKYVVESSPAYQNGIRVGDELLSVDDYEEKQLKIWNNYLKKDQTTIRLKVKSKASGEIKEIALALKRLI